MKLEETFRKITRMSSVEEVADDLRGELKQFTKAIFAKPINFAKKFKPPKPDRESEVIKDEDFGFIKPLVKGHSDFVLSHLTDPEVDLLVQSMEKITVAEGENIIEQGEVGDFLYVLKEGSIRYLVDGKEVGTAGSGEIFGELALLYDCPRAATVVADEVCELYRAARETFRTLQASFVLEEDDATRKLLKKTQLFADLPEDLIREMATYLFQKKFHKDDVLIKKGELCEEIYFVKEGRLVATEIHYHGKSYNDLTFTSGDSVGERAIVMDEAAIGTVTCATDGVAYVLTKERFLYCMQGMNMGEIVDHSIAAKVLNAMPFFANSDISGLELQQIAKKMEHLTLEPGETLASIGDMVEPAMYFIAMQSKDPVVEVTDSEGSVLQMAVSEPFGFGKHALIVSNLGEEDAKRYREENHLIKLGSKEDIQKQKRNILKRNKVVSQYTVKVGGTETVHLNKLALADITDIIYEASRLGKNFNTEKPFDASITHETLEKRVLLGQGSFGQVWLCRDPIKDVPYALKIQHKRELINLHQAAGVIRETRVMKKMHHPFVMGIVQAEQDRECLYMIMKPSMGGELRQQMRNEKRPCLSEPAAKFYAACILEGLSYMHRRNFIYRDLKGENVLLDKDGYCVIIDFGFAKHVTDKTFTFCGTPVFIAPEILLSKGHNSSADIWSFGVLIYEMLFGTNPFFDYDDPTIDQNTLFKRIAKASFQRPRKKSSIDAYYNTSDDAKDLIKKLLTVKVNKRLGCMGQGDLSIRNHPWFDDIDFAKLYRKEIDAPWVPEISNPFDGTNFETVEEKNKDGLRKLSAREQEQFAEFG